MKPLLYMTISLALFALACPPPPPPPNGFSVQSQFQEFVNGIPTTSPRLLPLVGINSNLVFANKPTTGTHETCNGFTDTRALLLCPDRKVPAFWKFLFTSGPRIGHSSTTQSDIYAGTAVGFKCEHHYRQFFLSPGSIDLDAPPATIEMIGAGMYSTYGMPVIQFVNATSGDIVSSTTASAISPDGTWIEAVTPFFGTAYSGEYVAVVFNVRSDGSLEGIGGDWLYLYGNDPPPPLPPDPDPSPCGDNPCDVLEVY